MNYVEQAFAISEEDKRTAEQFYKDAITLLVSKHYVAQVDDMHTELSAIFGERWVCTHRKSGAFWLDAQLYAKANIAFNYANCVLGVRGKFSQLAKQLVEAEERVSDATLDTWGEHMNNLLTCTNAKDFSRLVVS